MCNVYAVRTIKCSTNARSCYYSPIENTLHTQKTVSQYESKKEREEKMILIINGQQFPVLVYIFYSLFSSPNLIVKETNF